MYTMYLYLSVMLKEPGLRYRAAAGRPTPWGGSAGEDGQRHAATVDDEGVMPLALPRRRYSSRRWTLQRVFSVSNFTVICFTFLSLYGRVASIESFIYVYSFIQLNKLEQRRVNERAQGSIRKHMIWTQVLSVESPKLLPLHYCAPQMARTCFLLTYVSD